MSGFGAGGFAHGFTEGMGAVTGALGLANEQRRREQEGALLHQERQDRLALERDKLAQDQAQQEGVRDYQNRYLDLHEKDLSQRGALQDAQIRNYAKENQLRDAQIAQENFKTDQAKLGAGKAQYNEMLKAWGQSPNPLPWTPKLEEGFQKYHSHGIPTAEYFKDNGPVDHIGNTMQRLQSGEIGINHPDVGLAMHYLRPDIEQRNIGEILDHDKDNGQGEIIPAGAKITGKRFTGVSEFKDRVVPMLEVTAEKDGKRFVYHAPTTENGIAGKEDLDKIVSFDPHELMKPAASLVMMKNDQAMQDALRKYALDSTAPQYDAKDLAELENKRSLTAKNRAETAKTRAEVEGGALGKRAPADVGKFADGVMKLVQGTSAPEMERGLNQRYGEGRWETDNPEQAYHNMLQSDAMSVYQNGKDSGISMDDALSAVKSGRYSTFEVPQGPHKGTYKGYITEDGKMFPVAKVRQQVAQPEKPPAETKPQGALAAQKGATDEGVPSVLESVKGALTTPSAKQQAEAREARRKSIVEGVGGALSALEKGRQQRQQMTY